MSLTSLLKEDKELRNEIIRNFNIPKPDDFPDILIPSETISPNLVGTAFDYLFRFVLDRLNQPAHQNIWIAELALKRISGCGDEIVDKVKDLKSEYMESGVISRELIRETIRMSYIDHAFRSGTGYWYIGARADEHDVDEIESQLNIVAWSQFASKKYCYLNPNFGLASRMAGGADADFICDDMLVDIKTTKSMKSIKNDLCQLIGYYLLSRIGGVNGNRHVRINRIAVYYSRFAYLYELPIGDIIHEKDLNKFIIWFEDRIFGNYFRMLLRHKLWRMRIKNKS